MQRGSKNPATHPNTAFSTPYAPFVGVVHAFSKEKIHDPTTDSSSLDRPRQRYAPRWGASLLLSMARIRARY
jgi:hypothetical protein